MIGLLLAVGFIAPVNDAVILTYHDMIDSRDKNALWFDCTAKELEDQILWMKDRGANFVGIQQIYDRLKSGQRLPSNAVSITFADNYLGFKRLAWPILKKHQIPVTMFVHTGHVGSTKGRPKMTWGDLKELKKSKLFEIGSQTVTHPADLSKLTVSQIDTEFTSSWSHIQKNLPSIPLLKAIAYPNGKYSKVVSERAKANGYAIAFTEDQKPISTAKSLWEVPRYVHTKYQKAWLNAKFK